MKSSSVRPHFLRESFSWLVLWFCLLNGMVASALTINPESRTFAREGGGAAIIVTAGETESWTVTTDAAWINVTPTKAGKGNGTVTYLIGANLTADQRVGHVSINTVVHTVYQNGYDATVTPPAATYDRTGGTGTLTIVAQAGVSWTAVANAPWIIVSGRTTGTGSGSTTYAVSPFTGTGSRTGTLSIAGKVVTVTQNGVDIALSPEDVHVDDRSNLILFSVTALATQKWEAVPTEAWISVITPGTGAGDSAVTLAVGENPSYLQRVGFVNVGSATFRIVQDGNRAPTLAIDPPSATAGAAGAFGLVAVSATPDAPWSAISEAPWLTITEGASGAGSGNIRYVVSANPTVSNRIGALVIAPSPQQPPADLYRGLVGHFPNQETQNRAGRAANLGGPLEFVANESFLDGLLARHEPGFTFSFWFKPTYLGRVNRLVEFASGNGARLTLYSAEDNRLWVHALLPDSAESQPLPAEYSLNNTNFQHLTGILSATNTLRLYLDRTKVFEARYASSPVPATTNTGRIWFGKTTLPVVGNYAGSIANVRVYHRDLSTEELGLLCDLENAGNQLAAYNPDLPLDELGRVSSYVFADNGFDTSKHGRTAPVGNLIPEPDRFGRKDMALGLAPAGFVELPLHVSAFSSPNATVNLWVKFNDNPIGSVAKRIGGIPLRLERAEGGFRLVDDGAKYNAYIEKAYDPRRWHMVTLCATATAGRSGLVQKLGPPFFQWMVWSEYSYRVYIDGELIFQTPPYRTDYSSDTSNSSDAGLRAAHWGLGDGSPLRLSDPSQGGLLAVDDAECFDGALSSEQVASLYAVSRPALVTHTVTQTPAAGSLSSDSGRYPASGATGSTRLTINTGVAWSARSNVPWINVVSAADAAGSADVTFRLDDNPTVYPRDGTLTIAGLTYTATQSGRNHSVDRKAFTFGPDGGLGVFNLATEANATWQAVAADDWITIAQGQTGTGPAAVMFVTSPYASPTGYRSGTITLGSAVVQVTQIGYEAAVSPLVQAIAAGGGQAAVQVGVPIGAVWEAVVRVPWITLVGGQTRTGSGELNYIVAGNPGPARSGTILVAGREVTVTQSAAPADDTNNNGIPDAWEMANLGNLAQGAADDPDGDGFSNYVEWRYNTNPKAAASQPDATLSIYRAVELRLGTVTGVVYDLESSSDLNTWTQVGSPIVGDGRPLSNFYRAEEPGSLYYRLRLRSP